MAVVKDWTHKGLRCVVYAHRFGHLCGYVGVPSGHVLHGAAYNLPHAAASGFWERVKGGVVGKRGIFPILCADLDNPSLELVFDVHGSLTYSGGGDYPVSTNGLWWFGFDAGHCDDSREVQNEAYMAAECESLADQLTEVQA